MAQSAVQIRDCPNCTSNAAKSLPHYSQDTWNVVSCTDCSMVYLRNPVEYVALEEDFAWEKTYAQEDQKRDRKRSWVKRVAHHVRVMNYRMKKDANDRFLKLLGPGKILDVGCGDVVRWSAPFVPHGIEISKFLAQRADEKMKPLGGECIQGPGAEAIWEFDENQFDSIMMHSYLEHETQVSQILDGAFRCLRPDGKIFVRVPNYNALNRHVSGANWPGFRYPDHVNYFTVRTLKSVAENAGFEFKLANRHKIWLDDNIHALLIKPQSLKDPM